MITSPDRHDDPAGVGHKRSMVPMGRWRAANLADARAKTVGESSGQNHPHPDEFCPSGHEQGR
jgi:hypothetical protein